MKNRWIGILRGDTKMLRTKTGRRLDSGGVNAKRTLMRRRRMAPRGATVRITAKKW
jgi:hypothetical protein